MALNPNIILQGRGVNALGAVAEGNQAAAQTNQIQRQNALSGFLRDNGQSVMQGDPAALGQYAALAGPEAAMGVQQANLSMDATRLGMDATRQQMQFRETAEGRTVAQYAAQQSAEQVAGDVAKVEEALKTALPAVVSGDINGFNQISSQYGLPPVQTREQMIAIMAQYDGVRSVLKDTLGMVGGQSEGFRQATPEESAQYGAQAGQFGPDGKFYPINPPRGMSLTVGPDGTVRMTEGNVGESDTSPSSPAAMISSIDGILNDPALDISTGMLSPLQNVPGTPQRRFGSRTNQLEGQAFLQAFESLKGGGQITEIEGQKATQAIGRLDTSQSAEDYRNALLELRETLAAAASRPPGWINTPEGQQESAETPASGDIPAWMLSDIGTWTPEQMDEAERIWGLK